MPLIVIACVGLAQIIGIGSLYYAFPALSPAMADEFGHPVSWLLGCLTATILVGGLASPLIGKLIDRRGGYLPIVLGSLLGVISLTALGLCNGLISLTIALLAGQIASNLTLYEAMFPALMQIDRVRARRLITEVSLFGGLSSTAFWPLTQWLFEAVGWRNTFFVFAAINLFVCTPIYAFSLRKARPIALDQLNLPETAPALGSASRKMIYFTAAICLISFSQQAINYDFIPALISHGLNAGTVAVIGTVIGPCTVIARLLDIGIGGRFTPMTVAVASIALMSVSLLVPTFVPTGSVSGLVTFAILFGVGQGIFVIARGTLPLTLFGPVGYGARLGVINAYRRYVVATSPFLFAYAIEQLGVRLAFAALALVSFAGLALLCKVKA